MEEPVRHQLAVDDSVHATSSDEGTLTVFRSAEQLLKVARSLIDSGEFSVATVVLHMACEIATEGCVSAGLARAGGDPLERAVGRFVNGYSFLQTRNQDLYNAVSGDRIQGQPFWIPLLESTRRRNRIVHRGLLVDRDSAESSFSAVSEAVAHLRSVEMSMGST